MDKVLKRRLVGATILIALAVIFLPMLLNVDDEELVGRQVDMALPERPDSGEEIRRIPLDPAAARRREPENVPPPVTDDPPPESRAVPDNSAGEVVSVDPEESMAMPDDPAPEPALEEAVDEPSPESEPVSEGSEPVAADVPAAAAGGDWLVQVASFGSRETAAGIARRLESLGHPVTTDRIARGDSTLHRVRTGPYASEAAAEQARGQIVATVAGVKPIVTANDRPAGPDGAESESGFAVQAGVFSSRENAEGLAERLESLDFRSFVVEDQAAGRPVWRVRVGPEPDRAAAEALMARLEETAEIEGLVVSHP